MDVADEAGVTFIDTADVYPPPGGPELWGRSETIVGQWLRARSARHRFVVATKVGRPVGDGPDNRGLRRTHIVRACEESLRRLQTDYVDLYQTHLPDPSVPIDETLRALDDLVRAGKVRHVGCSNYSAQQLAEALGASDALGLARFECAQLRYNLLFRLAERTLLPLCAALGLGLIGYSPLAGGALVDRPSRAAVGVADALLHPDVCGTKSESAPNCTQLEISELRRFLRARGKSLTQAALAWVLSQPAITSALVGASRPEQLAETLRGVGSALDDVEWSACDAVWRNILGRIKDQRQ
jgi:aryl-alcohol dehydrogenase (NADP+)